MKIAIYSRNEIEGKGESIESQIELCREYINKKQGNQTVCGKAALLS